MKIDLYPFAIVWAVLLAVVGILALYRKLVANNEDDQLHVLDGDAQLIPKQIALANRLDMVDKWGKMLTVVAVVYAILLGGIYAFQLWQQSSLKMWSE